MSSPHSVDSDAVPTLSLNDHITSLCKAFDATIKLARTIGEARGSGNLKSGAKLRLADGRLVGVEELNSYASSVKNSLREIPKIQRARVKIEKAERTAKHADRKPIVQKPSLYKAELVAFFNATDLGLGPDGAHRLQENEDMSYFFKNGVGNLTFGVSMFNTWGNIQKIKTGNSKVFFDTAAKTYLGAALEDLKAKKRAIVASSDVEDKKKETATKDLERLDQFEIQNKDYMSILSFLHNKENEQDLSGYAEVVSKMSELTKKLNNGYSEKIKSSRPAKSTKPAAKETVVAPVATTKPITLPPAPQMGTKVPVTIPPVATVSARGASPSRTRR